MTKFSRYTHNTLEIDLEDLKSYLAWARGIKSLPDHSDVSLRGRNKDTKIIIQWSEYLP